MKMVCDMGWISMENIDSSSVYRTVKGQMDEYVLALSISISSI